MKSLVAGICILLMSFSALADEKKDNELRKIPKLKDVDVVVDNINSGRKMKFDGHRRAMNKLLNEKYMKKLHSAMYTQDILHAADSKAHFDNCDFDGAISYVESFIAEIDSRHASAKTYIDDGNIFKANAEIEEAFFIMGQALHAIQDFYAHTNYVDKQVEVNENYQSIEVIPVWLPEGKTKIQSLIDEGLVSGVVGYGFPKRCADKTQTHSELSKDTPKNGNGAIKLKFQPERNKYDATVYLAREASKDFFAFAFSRWPIFALANGDSVAYSVLVDRRN